MNKTQFKKNLFLITYFVLLTFFFIYIKFIFNALNNILTFLTPVFIGIFLAFLLNRPIEFIENNIFSKIKKNNVKKTLSIFFVYLIFILSIILFFYILIPQVIKSIYSLADNIPIYSKALIKFSSSITKGLNSDISDIFKDLWLNIISKFTSILSANIPKLTFILEKSAEKIISFFLGFIFSIYMLFEKDTIIRQTKKLLITFLPKKLNWNLFVIGYIANITFYNFIISQIIDSTIVGILCFVSMQLIGLDYTLLISLIIAITNIVPIAGPWIGAIISISIILMSTPSKIIIFIIFIVVLQQLESNLIYPKIVSKATGISGLWALFAIFIGGKILGILGMLLGVPVFAIIYSVIKDKLNNNIE